MKKINRHAIIITVLTVTALIYVGMTIGSGDATATGESLHMDGEENAMDMAGFAKNLPADPESLVSMGNALMDNGRYSLALECYSRALEQRPEDTDIRTDLGTCRHAIGQNEQAIEDFMKVLELDPTHQIAKFNLGIVYMSLGDTTQTFYWWQKLLDENPTEELKARLTPIMKDIRQGS